MALARLMGVEMPSNVEATEFPVKLVAMANRLGLEVYYSSLKPEISGLIEPSETAPSGFRIRLNRHEPKVRQRFTLAHEIGHFVLHRSLIGAGIVDSTMYRSNLSDRREREANQFAASLLMPWSAIKSEGAKISHLEGDDFLVEMARRFKVSREAMKNRLSY